MGTSIQSGVPDNFPVKVFETDVAQVSVGTAQGGWVSGSPASLAASASVNCVFDLGQDWHQFPNVSISVLSSGPSSGLNGIQASSSDSATPNAARRLKDSAQVGMASIGGAVTTAGGALQTNVRPMGRYLIVTVTNADGANAQGSTSKVTIAAQPN